MEIIVYLFLNGPVLCGKENNKKGEKNLAYYLGSWITTDRQRISVITLNVSPDRQKLLLKHLIILFTFIPFRCPHSG